MKNRYSFIACCAIFLALCIFRVSYSDLRFGQPALKITQWDAFGYYAYLPALCLYHDCKQLHWLTAIDGRYGVTGGDGWQAERLANGNYVFKYLGGVALMQLPLFYAGHLVAGFTGAPQDGFSPPYQYALAFGILLYCMLAILLLRRLLLSWFGDRVTAITLVMVCLATNFIQYAAVDSGQSHAYIFPLYVLVMYASMQWHRRSRIGWAALTGYVVGLATICRPTEAIMVFIPLLWNTHTKKAAQQKWMQVRQHKSQIAWAGIAGLLGILPQLIYWKYVTGSWVYDVGSKWEFLSPYFRVLLGWEKGWFIYTPVTVFFIAGMFFIRKFPFRKPVLWFCLLNIYIIIAWHDWRYGGSYSTRALVQSYPVFALPFAALGNAAISSKWRIPFYIVCGYLLFVNLFQTTQYCSTILHYNDMNRLYYSRIYLNPSPSPADMSLLDNDEIITNEHEYTHTLVAQTDTAMHMVFSADGAAVLTQRELHFPAGRDTWIKIETAIYAPGKLWQTYLNAALKSGDSVKHARVRLFSPISRNKEVNRYVCYIHVPQAFAQAQLSIYLSSAFAFDGVVQRLSIMQEVK